MWQRPGFGILQELAFNRIWQCPGCGSLQDFTLHFQDLAFSRVWRFSGFGILQDVAVTRLCSPRDLAVPRIWERRRRKGFFPRICHLPRSDTFQDLAAAGLWAVRRRKGSLPTEEIRRRRRQILALGKNSVRYPNARVPRAVRSHTFYF